MSDPHSPALNNRQGHTSEHTLPLVDQSLPYTAEADWLTVYEREKPVAVMFYVAYLLQGEDSTQRPLTFVFNGGPGAASAYLHMGALGPRRVQFGADGTLPKPPLQVADNPESWLRFTDLVFIDPVGTGFSRQLPPDTLESSASGSSSDKSGSPTDKPEESPFWEVERDLKALGEFMQAFLSQHQRWLSPLLIAGESYGGFRVARLAQMLQQDFGLGLSGAILISPALEFSLLEGSDYNLSYWATLVPSFAAAAAHHQRVSVRQDRLRHQQAAETLARQRLLPLLALGSSAPATEQQSVYQELADLIGLPLTLIQKHGGRIDREVFARELLRDQGRVLGLYDASITSIDPFPDRLQFEGSDPTLDGVQRLFTGAINHQLRDHLGVKTDLMYHLLNFETFKAWKFSLKTEFKMGYLGAMDQLRVGLSLNPHMRVHISHGVFDLVTTYFASMHLVDLMKLDPALRPNLTLTRYDGGHMFYSWDQSRQSWYREMQTWYASLGSVGEDLGEE